MVAVRKKRRQDRYECPARITVQRWEGRLLFNVYRTDRDHPYSLAMSFTLDDHVVQSKDMCVIIYGSIRENMRQLAGPLRASEGSARKRASKPRRITGKKRV